MRKSTNNVTAAAIAAAYAEALARFEDTEDAAAVTAPALPLTLAPIMRAAGIVETAGYLPTAYTAHGIANGKGQLATCPRCGHKYAEDPEDLRGAFVMNNANSGKRNVYGCPACLLTRYPDNTPHLETVGVPRGASGVCVQVFIPCVYNVEVAREFAQGARRNTATQRKGEGAWMLCEGGLKSPVFRNTSFHRIFETFEDNAKQGNQYRPRKVKVTGEIIVTAYRETPDGPQAFMSDAFEWHKVDGMSAREVFLADLREFKDAAAARI